MSANALRRLSEIVDEMFAAENDGDEISARLLMDEEDRLVNSLNPPDKYQYRLSLAAAFFDCTMAEIDRNVSCACHSDEINIKTARLEEAMFAFSSEENDEGGDRFLTSFKPH